jgi:hypothetical protein
MVRKFRLLGMAGALSLMASSGHRRYESSANTNGSVRTAPAPNPAPPARADSIPESPGNDFVWVEGQWVWRAQTHQYEWAPGYWLHRKPLFVASARLRAAGQSGLV